MNFAFDEKKDLAYGGDLLCRRKGRRAGGRPLTTRTTMHLVLRSSRAQGAWSFRRPDNKKRVHAILLRFAARNGVRLLGLAVVSNHLHLHVKLGSRHTYKRFIRAVTAAIAMAITGASRWKKLAGKFWDRRPFSRILRSAPALKNLRDYLFINQLEAVLGFGRKAARVRTIDYCINSFVYNPTMR